MLFIVLYLSQEERIYEYIVQVQYTVQLKVSKCVYLFINLKILILCYWRLFKKKNLKEILKFL